MNTIRAILCPISSFQIQITRPVLNRNYPLTAPIITPLTKNF